MFVFHPTKSVEYVHIDREGEPMVRKYEKQAWEFLTRKKNDFAHFIRRFNRYLSTYCMKAVLVPGRPKLILVNPQSDKSVAGSISYIQSYLRDNRSPYSVSFAKRPKIGQPQEEARVIGIDDSLTEDELLAFEVLIFGIDALLPRSTDTSSVGSKRVPPTYDSIMHKLNGSFFPASIQVLILREDLYEVALNLKDPSSMVARLQEIFEEVKSLYTVDLTELPKPKVTSMQSLQQEIGAA